MWVLYVDTNKVISHRDRWYVERYAVPFRRGGKQVEIEEDRSDGEAGALDAAHGSGEGVGRDARDEPHVAAANH